jgi:Flp pilus assembly protein protease CpaA
MFFLAMCVVITEDMRLIKFQNRLTYAVMLVPHVLIHFDTSSFNFMGFAVLGLLFGLPFACMQRKNNLFAAMGAHTFVDLVRFCLFFA